MWRSQILHKEKQCWNALIPMILPCGWYTVFTVWTTPVIEVAQSIILQTQTVTSLAYSFYVVQIFEELYLFQSLTESHSYRNPTIKTKCLTLLTSKNWSGLQLDGFFIRCTAVSRSQMRGLSMVYIHTKTKLPTKHPKTWHDISGKIIKYSLVSN